MVIYLKPFIREQFRQEMSGELKKKKTEADGARGALKYWILDSAIHFHSVTYIHSRKNLSKKSSSLQIQMIQ